MTLDAEQLLRLMEEANATIAALREQVATLTAEVERRRRGEPQ